ncbi:hypothetical protein HZS_617 [Henneguya salminicola]|nr:hypothetical protein HZS_617 [Henneguya salminicola]
MEKELKSDLNLNLGEILNFETEFKDVAEHQETLLNLCQIYKSYIRTENTVYDETFDAYQKKARQFSIELDEIKNDMKEIAKLLNCVKNIVTTFDSK